MGALAAAVPVIQGIGSAVGTIKTINDMVDPKTADFPGVPITGRQSNLQLQAAPGLQPQQQQPNILQMLQSMQHSAPNMSQAAPQTPMNNASNLYTGF